MRINSSFRYKSAIVLVALLFITEVFSLNSIYAESPSDLSSDSENTGSDSYKLKYSLETAEAIEPNPFEYRPASLSIWMASFTPTLLSLMSMPINISENLSSQAYTISPASDEFSDTTSSASETCAVFENASSSIFDVCHIIGDSAQNNIKTFPLSLSDAIIMSLKRNSDLKVRKLEPLKKSAEIDKNLAKFDPSVSFSLSNSDRLGKQIYQTGALGDNVVNRFDGSALWKKKSFSGTEANIDLSVIRNRSARAPNLYTSRLGVELIKPLRQGSGKEVNLVSLKQAKLDERISEHELNAFILSLIEDVEKKYWGVVLAREELSIVIESKHLAIRQLQETNHKIALGSIPESELAAAEAELALREEAVIDAQSRLEIALISFLRVINPDSSNFWDVRIELTDTPELSENLPETPVEFLKSAIINRPEIKESDLLLQRGALELVATKNGFLPKLDFFATLGKSGFGPESGESISNFGQKGYDLVAGLQYELPLERRETKSLHRSATYTFQQRKEALANLKRLVQEETLVAYIEAKRAWQQIQATAKTVEKQNEKLRVETVKFNLGKSTSFQVAQAQRDSAASKISQTKARIAYIGAITALFHADGSLAQRRNLQVGDK
ncbi:MAG: TolC family protein [Candidatus Riflebacteria bacterium]|nr:TolC family protein [Candidatus Riflebacteria bacterium]